MHFASMSLGIFDFLINWLTEFIIWVVGWVFELINTLLAQLWFKIGTSFANIADMLQGTFRKLCGMDVYWVGTEKVEGIDPLLQMFTNSNVVQVLIALSLVAVVMVIVAAIIQVIRIEFTTEGSKNSKGAIFGQALKSLLMFFLVPICCFGGVAITNALLKTVDRATNLSSGTSSIGSTIFVSAAANTNRVRYGSDLTDELKKWVGISGNINETNREECAQIIDNFFKDNEGLSWSTGAGIFDSGSAFRPYANWEFVILYYNVYELNYLLYIGASLAACGIMINATFGMIMRLIKGAILFMVSPPVVALMPLTNSPFNSWKKSFLANILGAYGTIVGFNLVMLVLPVVNNIKLFQPLTFDGMGAVGGLTAGFDFNGANGLVTILVTLTGLFMIKDLIKFLSDMINADDVNAIGGPMAKKVGKTVGTMAAVAAAPVALAAAPGIAAAGAKLAAGGGKFAGLGKAMNAVGNTLGKQGSKFLQKGLGNIGKAANDVIGGYTGGMIKPFSEETDVEKAQEARDKKRKARAERIKNGEGTIGDRFMSMGSEDEIKERQQSFDDFMSGGQTKRKREREKKEKDDAFQKGASEQKTGFASDLAGIKGREVTIDKNGQIKVGKITGKTLSQKATIAKSKGDSGDASGFYDALMEILNTLKNQNEQTKAVKDAIQAGENVRAMMDSGHFTANQVVDSKLFKQFRHGVESVQADANNTIKVINSSKFDLQAIMDSSDIKQTIADQIDAYKRSLPRGAKVNEELITKAIHQIVQQTKQNIEKAMEEKNKDKK